MLHKCFTKFTSILFEFIISALVLFCLQYFDTVGLAAGMASGL